MPTSQHHQLSKIMNLIITYDPHSVLDIGVGFGKYGVLCREYLEFWDGREKYSDFTRRIDGIEAFEDYITPLHKVVYDKVYIGDALKIVTTLRRTYDLVLLIDVLEHFSPADGKRLIKTLLKRHKGILISVPKDIGSQGDAFNNPYETHKAQWNRKTLSALGTCFFLKDPFSHIAFIGQKKTADPLEGKLKMKNLKTHLASIPPVLWAYKLIKR